MTAVGVRKNVRTLALMACVPGRGSIQVPFESKSRAEVSTIFIFAKGHDLCCRWFSDRTYKIQNKRYT